MTMKRLGWKTRFGRSISLAMAAILFAGLVILAQAVTSSAAAPLVSTEGKALTFDVVSVREDNSESTPQNPVQNRPNARWPSPETPPVACDLVIDHVEPPSEN